MNPQHFIQLLRQPNKLNEQTLEHIGAILDEYPFFQAGRILWIKNLHLLGHIRFNNELKLAACHLSDRSRLYHFLNPVSFVEKVPVARTGDQEMVVEPARPMMKDTRELRLPVDEFDPNEAKKTVTTEEGTPLNANNIVNLPSGGEPDLEIPLVSKVKVTSEAGSVSRLLQHELLNPQVPEFYISQKPKADQPRTFSEWLAKVHDQPLSDTKPTTQDSPAPKNSKMALVDNFLERGVKSPGRITSPADSFSENVDISAGSLEEKEDLMSETLAAIYIKQKHFSKAINIFERLSLIYPEKSIYFASRIKELEQQDSNNK